MNINTVEPNPSESAEADGDMSSTGVPSSSAVDESLLAREHSSTEPSAPHSDPARRTSARTTRRSFPSAEFIEDTVARLPSKRGRKPRAGANLASPVKAAGSSAVSPRAAKTAGTLPVDLDQLFGRHPNNALPSASPVCCTRESLLQALFTVYLLDCSIIHSDAERPRTSADRETSRSSSAIAVRNPFVVFWSAGALHDRGEREALLQFQEWYRGLCATLRQQTAEHAQRRVCQYVGLQNLGATCYMNSFLQTLFMNPHFRMLISQLEEPIEASPPEEDEEEEDEEEDDDEEEDAAEEEVDTAAGTTESATTRDAEVTLTSEPMSDEPAPSVGVSTMLHSPLHLEGKRPGILAALRALFVQLSRGSVFAADTRRVARALQLQTSRQEDATEFATLLLSALQQPQQEKHTRDIIADLFGGRQRQRIVCESCGCTSARVDDFYELRVAVPDLSPVASKESSRQEPSDAGSDEEEPPASSDVLGETETSTTGTYRTSIGLRLEETLSRLFAAEMLGGENAYHCDRCQRKTRAVRRLSVDRFPPYLHVCFERYAYGAGGRRKLTTPVDFPLTLVLGGVATEDAEALSSEESVQGLYDPASTRISRMTYELVGVLEHFGPSALSGHYVARLKDLSRADALRVSDVASAAKQQQLLSPLAPLPLKEENMHCKDLLRFSRPFKTETGAWQLEPLPPAQPVTKRRPLHTVARTATEEVRPRKRGRPPGPMRYDRRDSGSKADAQKKPRVVPPAAAAPALGLYGSAEGELCLQRMLKEGMLPPWCADPRLGMVYANQLLSMPFGYLTGGYGLVPTPVAYQWGGTPLAYQQPSYAAALLAQQMQRQQQTGTPTQQANGGQQPAGTQQQQLQQQPTQQQQAPLQRSSTLLQMPTQSLQMQQLQKLTQGQNGQPNDLEQQQQEAAAYAQQQQQQAAALAAMFQNQNPMAAAYGYSALFPYQQQMQFQQQQPPQQPSLQTPAETTTFEETASFAEQAEQSEQEPCVVEYSGPSSVLRPGGMAQKPLPDSGINGGAIEEDEAPRRSRRPRKRFGPIPPEPRRKRKRASPRSPRAEAALVGRNLPGVRWDWVAFDDSSVDEWKLPEHLQDPVIVSEEQMENAAVPISTAPRLRSSTAYLLLYRSTSMQPAEVIFEPETERLPDGSSIAAKAEKLAATVEAISAHRADDLAAISATMKLLSQASERTRQRHLVAGDYGRSWNELLQFYSLVPVSWWFPFTHGVDAATAARLLPRGLHTVPNPSQPCSLQEVEFDDEQQMKSETSLNDSGVVDYSHLLCPHWDPQVPCVNIRSSSQSQRSQTQQLRPGYPGSFPTSFSVFSPPFTQALDCNVETLDCSIRRSGGGIKPSSIARGEAKLLPTTVVQQIFRTYGLRASIPSIAVPNVVCMRCALTIRAISESLLEERRAALDMDLFIRSTLTPRGPSTLPPTWTRMQSAGSSRSTGTRKPTHAATTAEIDEDAQPQQPQQPQRNGRVVAGEFYEPLVLINRNVFYAYCSAFRAHHCNRRQPLGVYDINAAGEDADAELEEMRQATQGEPANSAAVNFDFSTDVLCSHGNAAASDNLSLVPLFLLRRMIRLARRRRQLIAEEVTTLPVKANAEGKAVSDAERNVTSIPDGRVPSVVSPLPLISHWRVDTAGTLVPLSSPLLVPPSTTGVQEEQLEKQESEFASKSEPGRSDVNMLCPECCQANESLQLKRKEWHERAAEIKDKVVDPLVRRHLKMTRSADKKHWVLAPGRHYLVDTPWLGALLTLLTGLDEGPTLAPMSLASLTIDCPHTERRVLSCSPLSFLCGPGAVVLNPRDCQRLPDARLVFLVHETEYEYLKSLYGAEGPEAWVEANGTYSMSGEITPCTDCARKMWLSREDVAGYKQLSIKIRAYQPDESGDAADTQTRLTSDSGGRAEIPQTRMSSRLAAQLSWNSTVADVLAEVERCSTGRSVQRLWLEGPLLHPYCAPVHSIAATDCFGDVAAVPGGGEWARVELTTQPASAMLGKDLQIYPLPETHWFLFVQWHA